MRALLDTNVLVRHVTGDPPGQARKATAFLRGRHELILTDLVVAEMVYVLESFYEAPRAQISELVRSLLAFPSVAVADDELLFRAVELYQDARLDFAVAYLAALAELTGINRVASFDRHIDRVKTIKRIQP